MLGEYRLLILLLWPIAIAQQVPGPGLRPRGRIRISDMQMPPVPAPAPVPVSMSWPSFGTVPASSTVHTHIPLLREPQSSTSVPPNPGQEAVVYGNWKPDHPQHPDEQRPKERVYGRLEAMLMGIQTDDIDQQTPRSSEEEMEMRDMGKTSFGPVSYHNSHSRRDSFDRSPEVNHGQGHGRRRISNNPSSTQFEVLKMNATDPLLKAMANQINESVETTTISTIHRKQQSSSADDNWMPLPYPYPSHSYDTTMAIPDPPVATSLPAASSTQGTQSTSSVSLNWPKDFLDSSSASTEPIEPVKNSFPNIDRKDENAAEMHYDDEDSLNSAQMHSELSIPETIVPQLPLNITRVGIPYEERNSVEEPTICVPLTVTETSLSSDSSLPLVVEVERVYCFPLPKVEVRTGSVKQVEHTITSSSPNEMEMDSTEETTPMPVATGAGGSHRKSNAVQLLVFTLILSIICKK